MDSYLINCNNCPNYLPVVISCDTLAEALMDYIENWTTNGLSINGLSIK